MSVSAKDRKDNFAGFLTTQMMESVFFEFLEDVKFCLL
jgi:hypothetical protein